MRAALKVALLSPSKSPLKKKTKADDGPAVAHQTEG